MFCIKVTPGEALNFTLRINAVLCCISPYRKIRLMSVGWKTQLHTHTHTHTHSRWLSASMRTYTDTPVLEGKYVSKFA